MKLLLGLVLAGISISGLPQPAEACWLCDPVAGTKATIRKPHRAIQAVADPVRKVLTAKPVNRTSGGSVGGFRGAYSPPPADFVSRGQDVNIKSNGHHDDTSDFTIEDIILKTDDPRDGLILPKQITGSYLTGHRPFHYRRSSYTRRPTYSRMPSYSHMRPKYHHRWSFY